MKCLNIVSSRKQRCYCGLWPVTNVCLPWVWGALGKVTLLFLWHTFKAWQQRHLVSGLVSVTHKCLSPVTCSCILVCVCDRALLLFLFCFGYRSQWIDSEVHQAADRENPHKKTGKTSLNGLLVLTQSCMSLCFWLVHVREGTNTSPEWWKWLIAAAVVQFFRTNSSWCHASGLQVIWRISLVLLFIFLVSCCQQIP